MNIYENDGYTFTSAYSTPSTGSLDSIMDGTSIDSPVPSPTRIEKNQNYFENLKNRFSGLNEDHQTRGPKIGYSFDVFGTNKLYGRISPAMNSGFSKIFRCKTLFLKIVAGILFGAAEVLILAIATCAIVQAFRQEILWDIGGSVVGVAVVFSLSFSCFVYGCYAKRRKFLLPLIFQTILLLVAGFSAILIIVFTSVSDQPRNQNKQIEHNKFCIVLSASLLYELICLIAIIQLYRKLSNC